MPETISQTVSALSLSPFKAQPLVVEIGGIPIQLETDHLGFRRMIEKRYRGFLGPSAEPACRFEIYLTPGGQRTERDLQVFHRGSTWCLERGDFRAQWDLRRREGWIRQSANPYSLDSVLRITHSLLLAMEGGFLLHAASAVRNARAFVFAGVSGAGKTTMMRLRPADATVLSDEVSYIRPVGNGYRAYGTPFAGELARTGANLSAPLDTLFLLEQAPANRILPLSRKLAASRLMRHILFFAEDARLVEAVLNAAVRFVSCVTTSRLEFRPEAGIWDLVR